MAFSLWSPLYYSVSLFYAPSLKGIIKTKDTTFSTHYYNAKIFVVFLWLSLTHSLLCLISLFHAPSLKGIIKQGTLEPGLFLTTVRMLAKISLLFRDSLSFIHPILCSFSHDLNSKAIGRLLNSLLLLTSFFHRTNIRGSLNKFPDFFPYGHVYIRSIGCL